MGHVSTRSSAPEVARVYAAETAVWASAPPLHTASVTRRMFEMIKRNTPELAGMDLELKHTRNSCAGQFTVRRAYGTGALSMFVGINAKARNMGTLLHELAHAVHFVRGGCDYEATARMIMSGTDHDAEWRGILLALCRQWAPGYGMLLEVSFLMQGLTPAVETRTL